MKLGWVLLVAGCALEVPPGIDRDNDFRVDSADNCPDVANPDQSDFDGDGVGDACDVCDAGDSEDADNDNIPDGCDGCISIGEDADGDNIDDGCDDVICVVMGHDYDNDGLDDGCDPCPAGPQHDEDGDGKFDGCDNCPSVPNPQQENDGDVGPSDQVGDACDLAGPSMAFFDPLMAWSPGWFVVGSGFTLEGDQLRIGSIATSSITFTSPMLAGTIRISTHAIALSPLIGTAAQHGLTLTNAPDMPTAMIRCTIDGNSMTGEYLESGKPISSSNPVAVTSDEHDISLEVAADGTASCSTPDGTTKFSSSLPATTGAWYAGFFGSGGQVTFTWFYGVD